MLGEHLIDGPIDLLSNMPGEPLTTATASGGKVVHAFLLEAGPEFRLASAFLSVVLVSLSQFAMKATVPLPCRGRHKIGNAHIHPNGWGRWPGSEEERPRQTKA